MRIATIQRRSSLDRGHSHAPDHGHAHTPDHDHDHDHGHSHAAEAVRVAERAPTGHAVVFDIGDGIGALIVQLDDELAGTELPIESHDDPALHVHTGVWRRTMGNDSAVVAVFPELPEGRYWFPASNGHAGGEVLVNSGEIARLDLRLAT